MRVEDGLLVTGKFRQRMDPDVPASPERLGSPAQRDNYEIIGDGQGVHWPDVDEDLSVEGMFNGVPVRRPKR